MIGKLQSNKAKEVGYSPEVILAGRRINDRMGEHITSLIIKKAVSKGINLSSCKVLMLGFTFKENCPDIRNTKVYDIYQEFRKYNLKPKVYDPHADPKEVFREYGIKSVRSLNLEKAHKEFDIVILSVAHNKFIEIGKKKIKSVLKNKSLFVDLKGIFLKGDSDLRL